MKHWMKVLLAIILVLVLIGVAIPIFVRPDRFRPALESRLSSALGREVKLGELSLSVFSRRVVARDLSIAEDPNFGNEPFFTAKELDAGIELAPLVFRGELKVRGFAVVEPKIRLVRGAGQDWNFSTIGHEEQGAKGQTPATGSMPELTVDEFEVQDGSVVLDTLPPVGPALHYDHLNFSVQKFALGKAFPFSVSASLPGDAQVKATGNGGPLDLQNAAATPGEAQISVQNLNPVLTGFLEPGAGINFIASLEAQAKADPENVHASGSVHLDHLVLRANASPAPNPVDLQFRVQQSRKDLSGVIEDATVNTGNVAIHITGTYQLSGDNPQLKLKVEGQNAPIDDLQALMTAAGVRLPNGSVLKGGTLTTSLDISGPSTNLVITGPVDVTGTKLVGFDVGSKFHGVAAMSGVKTGDTTTFDKLHFDVRVTNAGVQVSQLHAVIEQVGEMTGSGTVSPKSELNFQLTVAVKNAGGIGAVGVQMMTKLNQAAPASKQNPKGGGVPMLVKGTANDPVITADVGGTMSRGVKSLLGIGKSN